MSANFTLLRDRREARPGFVDNSMDYRFGTLIAYTPVVLNRVHPPDG